MAVAHSQEAQRRIGATGAQPVDERATFFGPAADWPNDVVAMARQTDGYVFPIAPRPSANPPPAQPRNS